MKLLTKDILKRATAQFRRGSSMEQMIVAKFFDPCGSFTWYLMNIDPNNPSYAWGIVRGFEVEAGSFDMDQLQATKTKFGLGIERDLYFTPIKAKDLWEKLMRGEHV